MSEWKVYKLGNAPLEIIDGDRGTNYPKNHEFSDEGFCLFLSTKNVREDGFLFYDCQFITKEKDQLLRKGKLQRYDIILTTRGTVGNLGFYSDSVKFDNIRINSGMVIIRPKTDELLPSYCYYVFRKLQSEYISHISGSAQPQLPIKDLKEIDVVIPPLQEQERIAGILSSLDDKIHLLNRQNATLEAMAEALFRQYFIENPKEDWKDGVIADLIDFNPQRKLSKDTIAPFLEMSNLNITTYAPNGWYDRAFSSGTKFKNGDTLLARITPCLENGKTAYVDFLKDNQIAWGSTEYIVMCPKRELHPFFAYIVSKHQDFRDYAESCMSGSSGRQRVDLDNLKGYEMKIPDFDTIQKFNIFIEPTVAKMNCNNKQIRSLTKFRDTLLPKLMNNEIKI